MSPILEVINIILGRTEPELQDIVLPPRETWEARFQEQVKMEIAQHHDAGFPVSVAVDGKLTWLQPPQKR